MTSASGSLFVQGGADISECGRYRYRLWRGGWSSDDRACLFVMLNPSTADAMTDDATIRKCIGFTKRWGYGMLMVVNLFAYRSRHPVDLKRAEDPMGPENDGWVHGEVSAAHRVVLAWGSHHEVKDLIAKRVDGIKRTLWHYPDKVFTLGQCKDGHPRHPLMLSYETEPTQRV